MTRDWIKARDQIAVKLGGEDSNRRAEEILVARDERLDNGIR